MIDHPLVQLDLFADSRDTMLRNDVVTTLLNGDFQGARSAIERLLAEYPQDGLLIGAVALLAVESLAKHPEDHKSLTTLIAWCERQIFTAAITVLGGGASAWMQRHVWAVLAEMASELPYSANFPTAHGASLWLRAAQWNRAEVAVESIPSWRRIPVSLGWMVVATVRNGGLDRAWSCIFELAWMSPERFESVLDELKEPVLDDMMREFEQSQDDASSSAMWFPAFALIAWPSLSSRVRTASPANDSQATVAYACVMALLTLEKQGRQNEIGRLRKKLRGLDERLFQRYMKTR